MANEAVIVELLGRGGEPVDFVVADATAIEKGTICNLTGTRETSGASTVPADLVAGIAAAEKEASDGATNLALHQTGIFDLRATTGAAIRAGQKVRLSGANIITGIIGDQDMSKGYIVGTALEDTAAGTPETIEVDIGLR